MENEKNIISPKETTVNQPRYKSPALWISLLGLVGLLLQIFGVFEKIGLDSNEWEMLITAMLSILTAFGIINNPTKKDKL